MTEQGGAAHRSPTLPQVEKYISLLVQHHFDVAGVHQRIVHLVPLSITCLEKKKKEDLKTCFRTLH